MSRFGGILICLISVVIAVVFLWAIFLGPALWAFWAVAIPVILGFLAVLALLFWIGWTMAAMETGEAKGQAKGEGSNTTKDT